MREPRFAGVINTKNRSLFPTTPFPETHVIAGSYALDGITYAQNLFVAVGFHQDNTTENSDTAILTSSDGINWTRRDVGTTPELDSVAYGQGMFVAVGASYLPPNSPDGFESSPLILTSTNGMDWNLQYFWDQVHLDCVVYGDGRFFATGWRINGDGTLGEAALSSTNGIDWENRSLPMRGVPRAVAWGEGKYVAAGWYGEILS